MDWRQDQSLGMSDVQRDPRAGSGSQAEEAQVDPRKYSQSSSERFLEQSHSSMDRVFEGDCGRSCEYKVGSPSYLDKLLWRDNKPHHYSEPKLILDLSTWKQTNIPPTGDLAREEEPSNLFLEIAQWVKSTQTGLECPASPVSKTQEDHEQCQPCPPRHTPSDFSKDPESSFDLDVFITRALKLCTSQEEMADNKLNDINGACISERPNDVAQKEDFQKDRW